VDIDEIDDPHHKPDFRRANGAPQIIDAAGKNQRYSRPSGWGKELDDENALVNWKINRAIEGVAGDPALQARAAAAKEDDRGTWNELREAAINAGRGDQGADIGTALHAMSDRWEDPDDDFHPGEPYETHLGLYGKELERLGLKSIHVEVPIVNHTWRAAGTADRVFELTHDLMDPEGEILPAGTLVIGDLKTGKTLTYSAPGYSVQMAIYAGGVFYNVVDDVEIETPEINQRWALLIHLPSDRPECETYWVDLETGRWGAYLTQQVREWRKSWRRGDFGLADVVSPSVVEMVAETFDLEEADREWVKSNAVWVQHRLDQIKGHPEARKRLQILWPEHIKPKELRAGTVSTEAMLESLRLLSRVEAEYELSFVTEGRDVPTGRDAPDPNIPPSQQLSLLGEGE